MAPSRRSGLLSLTVLLIGLIPGAPQHASPTCGSTWTILPSPNVGTIATGLSDVAALGPDDVTAVGYFFVDPGEGLVSQTLVEHWDGTAWTVVPSPNALDSDELSGVAAISADDVWAVGRQIDNSPNGNRSRTLIEHWDGSTWSIVPSPNVGSGSNGLYDVAAVSPADTWAVGDFIGRDGREHTLTLHWDGVRWSHVRSPIVGTYANLLSAVGAVGPSDVWAAGHAANVGRPYRPLVEHWNGLRWSVVKASSPGSSNNDLFDVVALSGTDVWIVGDFIDGSSPNQTLTEHWDGARWTVVPSANEGSGPNSLYAASAVSSTNVWAVGTFGVGPDFALLAEQWTGTQWSTAPVPIPPGATLPYLRGADTDSSGQTWVVGGYYDGMATRTLIECISES